MPQRCLAPDSPHVPVLHAYDLGLHDPMTHPRAFTQLHEPGTSCVACSSARVLITYVPEQTVQKEAGEPGRVGKVMAPAYERAAGECHIRGASGGDGASQEGAAMALRLGVRRLALQEGLYGVVPDSGRASFVPGHVCWHGGREGGGGEEAEGRGCGGPGSVSRRRM